MAKVAASGPVPPSNTLQFGGGSKVTTTTLKRKTPSELRGELLKQKNVAELVDESPTPVIGLKGEANGVAPGCKKDSSKVPRYIHTRVSELFPVRKNSIRLKLLSEKEIAKDSTSVGRDSNLKNSSDPSCLAATSQAQVSEVEGSLASNAFCKNRTTNTCNAAEKCNDNTFRSVTELSSGFQNLSSLPAIDMDKALKGLVAQEPHSASESESSERICNLKAQGYSSDFNIPEGKSPLDLTLKTIMRIVSSSSVNWFHRIVNCGTFYHNGLQHGTLSGLSRVQDMSCSSELTSPGFSLGSFGSWVYPQSALPASVISALSLAEGGGQTNFLSSRHETWEDSFRSLYYMLRKKICNIFYVCTTQFVVMFTAYDSTKDSKRTCYAYISRSTRGLRSLLKEHDVCFYMPLCHSKVDEVASDDLIELSDLDRNNSGQDQHFIAMSDVDNTPQSLLMFAGNESVHGLYDFLLNHRHFLISLTGVDVPVLYSPVPFENAALTAPEVRCKEVRRADHVHFLPKESNSAGEASRGSSPGICYSVEIKDAYLPPWTISSICDAMRSYGTSFEASFTTESTSIGLNVGLDVVCQDSDNEGNKDDGLRDKHFFGAPNVTLFPHLRSAFLKGLKYGADSYTASLSQV